MPLLALVPIYFGPQRGLLDRLGLEVARAFTLDARLCAPWFDPERAYDASRGQYSSTLLLADLLAGPPDGADKVLGVTSVDLFIPVLTYVFGEAQLGGRAAVVSAHRLRPEVYGLAPDDALLGERLVKEAVHELGHAHGLVHCPDPDCVMHTSTYVEEIDLKSAGLCETCRGAIAMPGRGGL